MPERHFDGRRVRAARRALELSQTALAQAVGLTQHVTVVEWEKGNGRPEPHRLPSLAQALGKRLDDLFPREGAPDLADLRCDAGYPQNQTGRLIGTRSHVVVSNAERGVRRLNERVVPLLAAAYGVSVEELLAAQERSFGNTVPAPPGGEPVQEPPVDDEGASVPRTLAEKLTWVLQQTYPQGRPSDREIAVRGNAAVGRDVLDAALVEEVRTGGELEVPEEVLQALAAAVEVPALFFRSDSQAVHRIVSGVQLLRGGLTTMGARGSGQLPPELLEFITTAVDEITATEPPDPNSPEAGTG